MKEKLVSCILFFLPILSLNAQQHLVDSLIAELKNPMADSNRAMSMMRLAVNYEGIDTSKAYKAYSEAIQFASSKKLFYQLGRIYQNQSFLHSLAANYGAMQSSLDSAIACYKKSDHPNAPVWEANAYGDMANMFKATNDAEQAVQYNLRSIAAFEKLGLKDKLVVRYSNLATLMGEIREYGKQKEYALKAVDAARKTGANRDLFTAYYMLAHHYTAVQDSKSAKAALDSARKYFDSNIHVIMAFGYYLVSGAVFKESNELDSAFYFFNQAYELSEKNNYSYGKGESQLQMGAIAIMQKKFPEAEKYLLAGIKEAEVVNSYNSLDEGYKYLSDVYAETGRYKQAYEYFQKYKSLNDSVVDLASKRNITDLEKKYQTEKKDVQLKLQQAQIERKNILNYILIGSAVILLIFAIFLYRYFRQRQALQQQRIAELERSKLLTATEAILKGEEQERKRLAKDLHDGLGGMMSGIKYSMQTMKRNLIMTPENQQAFERNMDMLDSSINEMRRVAHNMMPEALVKFGLDTALNDFCSDVDETGSLQVNYQSIGLSNESIPQTTAIAVYRIVQELLNNTMKHASAKSAIVQVTKTNGSISITVEDDGKGFNTSILHSNKGIGWSNIKNRISYLNGRMDVRSDVGKGTSVHIELQA